MVLREFLGSTNLLGAQTLCIYKTTEIVIICEDKNLMLAAFQIMTSCLEGFNNS